MFHLTYYHAIVVRSRNDIIVEPLVTQASRDRPPPERTDSKCMSTSNVNMMGWWPATILNCYHSLTWRTVTLVTLDSKIIDR